MTFTIRCLPLLAILAACSGDRGASRSSSRPGPDAGPSAPDAGGEVERGITMTQIRVGDLVFDARTAGPKNGEAVFLLHGFPQTSRTWRHQLVALGKAGYRAIAPDQRGYSPGARPEGVEN